jgi:hypothetical protein
VLVGDTSVDAHAVANAGQGSTAGSGRAIASADGTSGASTATATTGVTNTQLVEAVSATTTAMVDGASLTEARAAIGAIAPTFITTDQGEALIDGAPSAGAWTVLNDNPTIKTAFGPSPSYYAIAELGGGHSAGGSASQTTTSEIDFTASLTLSGGAPDVVVGFYSPTVIGAGFTSLTLDITAKDQLGTLALHETFTTLAAAMAFFSDNAVDLGTLESGSTFTVKAVMSITGAVAGSGFDAGLIFGDPPAAEHAVASAPMAGQFVVAGAHADLAELHDGLATPHSAAAWFETHAHMGLL